MLLEDRILKKWLLPFILSVLIAVDSMAQCIPVYKDSSMSVERRVTDLLGRMTLREKIAQLSHLHGYQLYNGQEVDYQKLRDAAGDISYGCIEGFNLTGENVRKAFHAIQKYMVEETRLGIPVFTVTESLHGSVHDGSTIFPQSVAVGSTFNLDLAYQMTKAIATELRSQGVIQTLSPGLDVVRDLRWGRVEESFGEDPWLVGQMGIAQVKGYIDGGISPMLKPFGPGGAPLGGLNLASVESGERDIRNIHIKPYEMAVRNTEVKAVMTSYNSWNGIPNSASSYLLTNILRNEWGFKGYVYSDWGAVAMLKDFQHTAKDDSEAAIQALTAGVDLEASSNCYWALEQLIEQGRFDEKYVDLAVGRILRVKFELGLFENPYQGADMPGVAMRTKEAVELSRRVADESIVLLKNENTLLPLNLNKIKSLAVIGPNANQVQFGDYTWSRSNKDGVTPLEGLKKRVGNKIKINYAAPKQKHHADKQKEIEKSGFKTQTDDAALTQKEEIKSAKEDTAQTAKQKSDSANLASLLSKSGFGELKEEKEKELTKALAATSTDTTQQTENDVKSKGAIAKEALKYLSEDIKETIDSYKPPMMKVSMEMNPQNMGAVDVTLISRGQNLIVNVASSQDNMQMFMQNIQEFRTNLNNLGFTSLEMNFNFSGQSQNSGGGNNDRQWREDSAKRYEANSKIGAITDKIESLDIILPHPKYA
jgi:beta-glucosidase